ncbi:MAG: hypothetical protein JXB42_10410 [Deltaproteobacteria bacterium]|nr:hypothetical protein [Deltaproteobacteria bacterium]
MGKSKYRRRYGFIEDRIGERVDNIPKTGALTGRYVIDFYGCWWEVKKDADGSLFWIIGEYPASMQGKQ